MNKICKNIGVFIGKVTQKVKAIRNKLPKQELDSFTDGSKMYEVKNRKNFVKNCLIRTEKDAFISTKQFFSKFLKVISYHVAAF